MTKNKLYVLKVALSHSKRIWRRIEILGNQTLDQLHETIFDAFDRYDEHLYSFYMTQPGSKGRRRFAQATEYTHPEVIEPDNIFFIKKVFDASKTNIQDLNLEEKNKFEYLFDFGDEWLHEITVEKILDIYPDKGYPDITVKKGESPPQYANYDEEL